MLVLVSVVVMLLSSLVLGSNVMLCVVVSLWVVCLRLNVCMWLLCGLMKCRFVVLYVLVKVVCLDRKL